MSVSIEMPCGCKLNAGFVIAMCAKHAYELKKAEIENKKAYEQYERLLSESEGKQS